MSEPVVEDVHVDLDFNIEEEKVRIDLQVLQESIQKIEDYLNSIKTRIYNLENP